MKETTVKINSKYVNRMKSGNPIVLKEAIINVKDLHTEGMILRRSRRHKVNLSEKGITESKIKAMAGF